MLSTDWKTYLKKDILIMNDDYTPHNLDDLINIINTEWTSLVKLINEFTDSQKIVPGIVDDWSIKDLMAHITAWEKLAMDRINTTITGSPLKYPVISGEQFVDEFNRQVYETNRNVPLDEVQSDFLNTHERFMDQIISLDNQLLSDKLPFDWAGNLTVQLVISSNTHWHYVEHVESIEKWLEENES